MRALLRLAYDGTDFAGCPELPGERTVVGELRAALRRVSLEPVEAETLSRTDAGVHARGNLGHVVLPRAVGSDELLRILDRHLPADLRCTQVLPVQAPPAPGTKTYAYRIDRTPHGDPHRARTHWRVVGELDVDLLHRLTAACVGTHDFEAFRRTGETRQDLRRTLLQVGLAEGRDSLELTFQGVGFPYRLVRSLVGGMVLVARGSASPDALRQALDGVPGPVSRQSAPAHGLWLEWVDLG